MPLDAAQLTLAKLNSFLGGKGGEWGSEAPPAGAALPVTTRSKARELGNAGKTAAACDLLLKGALESGVGLPAALLDEIERTVLPTADNQGLRASIGGNLAVLRHNAATGAGSRPAAATKSGGFFGKLFKRG